MSQSVESFLNSFDDSPIEISVAGQPGFKADAGPVFMRPMTSAERDKFELEVSGINGKKEMDNFRARLVSRCVCDEEGNYLFADAEGAKKMGEKNARGLNYLFDKARELNGMEADAVDDAGKD